MKRYKIRYIAYGKTHAGEYEGSTMELALTAWRSSMLLKGYSMNHIQAINCELIQEKK